MKNIFLFLLFVMIRSAGLFGQDIPAKLKELAVPNSPAFILVDLTPSVFQTPNSPKEFILGVAQSFEQSSNGFPQNYSAEFTPYWWLNPSARNIYSAIGLRTTKDKDGKITEVGKENPFGNLKFTTISVAFINKDLIPDTSKANQKIFSLGIKSTIVKIHAKKYASTLVSSLDAWHRAAQDEFDSNVILQEKLARYNGDDEIGYQQKILDSFKTTKLTGALVKQIEEVINQKPLFSWDIAGALALYGVNDSVWKTGRSGVWTTISTYLPLAISNEEKHKNYLNLNFVFRYLIDNYQADKQKKIFSGNNLDIGGKFAMEFDKLSIGIEALYRFKNNQADAQNRTVGIINYKVGDNLYIRGAFGKNFNTGSKLITLFGINWGFGSEAVNLSQ